MKFTTLQTIAPLLLRNHDRTTMFQAGESLELIPLVDGERRDVIIRRPGEEDFIVWQGNIAGGTVTESYPAQATEEPNLTCPDCGMKCRSVAGLAGHSRVHKVAT
jgi:hypothetical protein